MVAAYFNPRTREGCDHVIIVTDDPDREISIHAPVKGATGHDIIETAQAIIISIHAPVKGATEREGRQ